MAETITFSLIFYESNKKCRKEKEQPLKWQTFKLDIYEVNGSFIALNLACLRIVLFNLINKVNNIKRFANEIVCARISSSFFTIHTGRNNNYR
jgi:hypothetical protein